MCIICNNDYSTYYDKISLSISCSKISVIPYLPHIRALVLIGCNSIISISSIPSLAKLYIFACNALTSIDSMPNLDVLECNVCTTLKTISSLDNVTKVSCNDCTSLTSIGILPKVTYFDYSGCRMLIDIPILERCLVRNDRCPWNKYKFLFTVNVQKLMLIQRWYRRLRWCRYLVSRDFIEWCYHPDNIGGKRAKRDIQRAITS